MSTESQIPIRLACTDIVVPFVVRSADGNGGDPTSGFVAALTGRRISRSSRRVWADQQTAFDKDGLDKLDVLLRSMIQGTHADPADDPWRLVSLELHGDAQPILDGLYVAPGKRYLDGPGFSTDPLRPGFVLPRVRAHLVLSPLGSGLAVLRLEWCAPPNTNGGSDAQRFVETFDELAHRLPHLTKLSGGKYWYWPARLDVHHEEMLSDELRRATPAPPEPSPSGKNTGADGKRKPCSLWDIVAWLTDGGGSFTVSRVGDDAMVHTYVLTDVAPGADELDELAARLARAAEPTQELPPRDQRRGDAHLVLRKRREMWIAREGTLMLAWAPRADDTFAAGAGFYGRAMGVYAWLVRIALLERIALGALSSEIGSCVAGLKSTEQLLSDAGRRRLVRVAHRATRYTASIVSADSGGATDYANVFHALRTVLGSPAVLAELREEIREAEHLVDTAFRWAMAEQQQKLVAAQEERGLDDKRREEADRRLHRLVGFLGVPGVIVASVAGVMGMNLPHDSFVFHPDNVPYLTRIVGGSLGVSLLFMAVLWARTRPRKPGSGD